MCEFKAAYFKHETGLNRDIIQNYGYENAKNVNAFHQSFPKYQMTPLKSLNALSSLLGVNGIYVKDESYRFGLNAFKVLGGSWCIGNVIAERLGEDIENLPYERLASDEIRNRIKELTFVTATDGNHGRGIAWTANRLKQNCVVYMPKGSAPERLKNIQALGADASITDLCYDDAVRLAASQAEKNGWILTQDTSWKGYEEIPGLIMQGYTTMAFEAIQQLEGVKPTHIFLQAGVGSLAGALTAFFADYYPEEERPIITIVESNKADCIYRTAKANDGTLHVVTEEMNTIMAGLACGEPCTIAWDILKDYANHFVSVPDYVSAKGMRILGNPMGNDKRIISGESGAVTTGLVAEVLQNENLKWLKEQLRLDEHSRILCFSTEGDTDKENYRRIVWDGAYASNG